MVCHVVPTPRRVSPLIPAPCSPGSSTIVPLVPVRLAIDTHVHTASPSLRPPDPDPDLHPQPLQDQTPLRSLTALEWPYVPDTTPRAFPTRSRGDDPKARQLQQYEAIGTFVCFVFPRARPLRTLTRRFHTHSNIPNDPHANLHLRTGLVTIDALRGAAREEAAQCALGVDGRLLKHHDGDANANALAGTLDEDTGAPRALAEAVEGAVRGESASNPDSARSRGDDPKGL